MPHTATNAFANAFTGNNADPDADAGSDSAAFCDAVSDGEPDELRHRADAYTTDFQHDAHADTVADTNYAR